MTRRRRKTLLMLLIERDHPGQSIEQIMLAAYRRCGTERAAAAAIGITQQTFNTWKFRLGIEAQCTPSALPPSGDEPVQNAEVDAS